MRAARPICVCLALIAPALGGCAMSYDDAAGNRHVIGFVDMTIAEPKDDATLAGNVVKVQTIGLLAADNAQGNTFSLGYASETTAAIKNNAFVLGNPDKAADQIFEGEKK